VAAKKRTPTVMSACKLQPQGTTMCHSVRTGRANLCGVWHTQSKGVPTISLLYALQMSRCCHPLHMSPQHQVPAVLQRERSSASGRVRRCCMVGALAAAAHAIAICGVMCQCCTTGDPGQRLNGVGYMGRMHAGLDCELVGCSSHTT
jgi:hypothetical protein